MSSLEFSGQSRFIWQLGSVLRCQNFVGEIVERIFDDGMVFFGAENHADRRIFARNGPVFCGIVQVEVHLTSVCMGEFADLQVNDDEAAQSAVEKQQIDAIPFIADAKSLPSSKRNVSSW